MRILCFGDSNTYGYDPRSYIGGRYDAENRWVEILAQRTGWEVVNAGLCGRRIPQRPHARKRVNGLLSEHNPDIFLIMLGTNDLLQGASAAEVGSRMEAFLMQILPACQNSLLLAPPALKRGAWVEDDRLVTESALLAEEYERLAARLGISFANTARWDITLAFDGVHFSEEGHQVFAEHLLHVLNRKDDTFQ